MTEKKLLPKAGTTFSQTKIAGQVNLAVFGDVHLGHEKTKTDEIVSKLYRLFPDDEATRNLDFIFIEGDLFERLLYLNNEYMVTIVLWMEWLLNKCLKYGIALRILEGTPSHDMRQPEIMASLAKKYAPKLDFKYADKLSIEFHAPTGLSILYLPDEWGTPENCIEEAKALIHSHGLTKVDLVCMHGAFDHQLPPDVGISTHNRIQWEALVNYYILVGHVHFPSQNGKVLAAGSFDRLKHGEEGPKGHLRITLKPKNSTVTFVENTLAKWYKTVCCRGLDIDAVLAKLEGVLKDAPRGSYFRIAGKREDSVGLLRSFLADRFPDFNWSEPLVDEDTEKPKAIKVLESTYQPIHLTKDNLPTLLSERLAKVASEDVVSRCRVLLLEAL